jgi:hypothetical protein
MKIFKKDILDIKQPQEMYCSTIDCAEMVALFHEKYGVLDELGIEKAKYFCINCLIEEIMMIGEK